MRCSKEEIEPPDGTLSRDPIRWFGGFVPGALKGAQARFQAVVGVEGLTELVNVTRGLHELEREVRRVRGELALLADEEVGDGVT